MRRGFVLLLLVTLAATACRASGPPASVGAAAASPSVTDGGGSDSPTWSSADASAGPSSSPPAFVLGSSAVSGGRLRAEYRCEPKVDGAEASIPLSWSGVPDGTRSLAVAMYHYPFPGDTSRVSSYLLLWGIPPSVTGIALGGASHGAWFMGPNKDGTAISYTSPCSKGAGTREYALVLYALSETPPSLPRESSLKVTYHVLTQAISMVRVLGTATLEFTDTTP